jgi:hypothetical protein
MTMMMMILVAMVVVGQLPEGFAEPAEFIGVCHGVESSLVNGAPYSRIFPRTRGLITDPEGQRAWGNSRASSTSPSGLLVGISTWPLAFVPSASRGDTAVPLASPE